MLLILSLQNDRIAESSEIMGFFNLDSAFFAHFAESRIRFCEFIYFKSIFIIFTIQCARFFTHKIRINLQIKGFRVAYF